MIDKRDMNDIFRQRLIDVIERSSLNRSAFADSIGIDRSALSQLLSASTARLPRAETLASISQTHGVTLDWLLGLSEDESLGAEIAPVLSIEMQVSETGASDSRLQQWRREVLGAKIRYVPATLPDLLRTVTVAEYELSEDPNAAVRMKQADQALAYSRQPDTDMEVCMPLHMFEAFAAGRGIWSGLSRTDREEQLSYMSSLLEEMYPTFRLFIYDQRRIFCSPYTVFGLSRAALYCGNMYIVLHTTEHIRALVRHFDNLIRHSQVLPHEAQKWVTTLPLE